MKPTTLYVILGAVALAVVALLLWQPWQGAAGGETIRTATVTRGSMRVVVSASGSVESDAQVDLEFETPGTVDQVLVAVGDGVEAGDPLARLDPRQLELQVQQARAALDLARVQFAQLREGPQAEDVAGAEANLRVAQAQVSAASAEYSQLENGPSEAQIAGAEAQVSSARLQYEIALDNYDQTIRATEDATRREDANYELYVAEKALEAAQAELDELLGGTDANQLRASRANVAAAVSQQEAAQAQLDLVLAGATEDQIEDAEAQVAQAEAGLAQAELALERATLRAPHAGIVAAVNVRAGEVAPTGLPAIVIVDPQAFRILVRVDEIDVGRLTNGQQALVTIEALPEAAVTGTVEHIAPVATIDAGVVYYQVTIDMDPTDAPLRADMTANVTIQVKELEDVLQIPTWIVRVDQNTGQTYVQRPAGGEYERVDVTLGVRYGGFVEVIDGLAEGDEIAWVPDEGRFGPGD